MSRSDPLLVALPLSEDALKCAKWTCNRDWVTKAAIPALNHSNRPVPVFKITLNQFLGKTGISIGAHRLNDMRLHPADDVAGFQLRLGLDTTCNQAVLTDSSRGATTAWRIRGEPITLGDHVPGCFRVAAMACFGHSCRFRFCFAIAASLCDIRSQQVLNVYRHSLPCPINPSQRGPSIILDPTAGGPFMSRTTGLTVDRITKVNCVRNRSRAQQASQPYLYRLSLVR